MRGEFLWLKSTQYRRVSLTLCVDFVFRVSKIQESDLAEIVSFSHKSWFLRGHSFASRVCLLSITRIRITDYRKDITELSPSKRRVVCHTFLRYRFFLERMIIICVLNREKFREPPLEPNRVSNSFERRSFHAFFAYIFLKSHSLVCSIAKGLTRAVSEFQLSEYCLSRDQVRNVTEHKIYMIKSIFYYCIAD